MAELADALDSGSSVRKDVLVRLQLAAVPVGNDGHSFFCASGLVVSPQKLFTADVRLRADRAKR